MLKFAAFIPETAGYLDLWRIGAIVSATRTALEAEYGHPTECIIAISARIADPDSVFATVSPGVQTRMRRYTRRSLPLSIAKEMFPKRLDPDQSPQNVMVPDDGGWNFTDCDLWLDFTATENQPFVPIRPVLAFLVNPVAPGRLQTKDGFCRFNHARALRNTDALGVLAPLDPEQAAKSLRLSRARLFSIAAPLPPGASSPGDDGNPSHLVAFCAQHEKTRAIQLAHLFAAQNAPATVLLDVFGLSLSDIADRATEIARETAALPDHVRIALVNRSADILQAMSVASCLVAPADSAFASQAQAFAQRFGARFACFEGGPALERFAALAPSGTVRFSGAADVLTRFQDALASAGPASDLSVPVSGDLQKDVSAMLSASHITLKERADV